MAVVYPAARVDICEGRRPGVRFSDGKQAGRSGGDDSAWAAARRHSARARAGAQPQSAHPAAGAHPVDTSPGGHVPRARGPRHAGNGAAAGRGGTAAAGGAGRPLLSAPTARTPHTTAQVWSDRRPHDRLRKSHLTSFTSQGVCQALTRLQLTSNHIKLFDRAPR